MRNSDCAQCQLAPFSKSVSESIVSFCQHLHETTTKHTHSQPNSLTNYQPENN